MISRTVNTGKIVKQVLKQSKSKNDWQRCRKGGEADYAAW